MTFIHLIRVIIRKEKRTCFWWCEKWCVQLLLKMGLFRVSQSTLDSETACSFKITACKFNGHNLPAGAIWRLPKGNHLEANVKVSCRSLINKANGFLVQKADWTRNPSNIAFFLIGDKTNINTYNRHMITEWPMIDWKAFFMQIDHIEIYTHLPLY